MAEEFTELVAEVLPLDETDAADEALFDPETTLPVSSTTDTVTKFVLMPKAELNSACIR